MEKLGFACVLRLSDDRGPGVDAVYGRLREYVQEG